MKVAILMWYDDHIKHYADNFYKINKLYCDKNGYDIFKSSYRVYRDRHYNAIPAREPHYERFPLILKYIKNYDYVVWIDADAYFYINAPPLEDLINEYPDKEILFSADSCRMGSPSINTGVFILKNTQQVINIVNRWSYCEKTKSKYYRVKKPNWIADQGMVRGCYAGNVDSLRDISVILPYLKLQHYHKSEMDVLEKTKATLPYIRHLAGRNDIRFKESTRYLGKLIDEGYLNVDNLPKFTKDSRGKYSGKIEYNLFWGERWQLIKEGLLPPEPNPHQDLE